RVSVNGQQYDVEVEVLDEGYARPVAAAPAAPAAPSAPIAPPVAPQVPVAAPAPAGAKVMNCPIPGTVVEVQAQAGQTVKRNDPLMIIDAMKMNTQISSTYDGVIKEILVKPGEPVKMGQPLVSFE
ncbi:acetyl-CoA carboxylase biotin carboxyl carrier protein subunit, partial [bacterium]|nr:acetyl-CoA carboxylase biotin carboxyl carrier protein subunit [bacterium]